MGRLQFHLSALAEVDPSVLSAIGNLAVPRAIRKYTHLGPLTVIIEEVLKPYGLRKSAIANKPQAQNRVELATQTLIDAVDQAEAMRYQVAGREVERQLFFENKVSSYNSLIDLLLKQGRVADAFLYAERAKGRVLLDVLNGGRVDVAKTLTSSEKKESERLNRRISEISDLIGAQEANRTLGALASLYTQLDAARLDYRSFEDAVYASHPELRIRGGRTAVLTTADMNRLHLDRGCAYLEYVVSKDGVSLFVPND